MGLRELYRTTGLISALGATAIGCSEMPAPNITGPNCCPPECIDELALDFCRDFRFEAGANPFRIPGIRTVAFADVSDDHCGYTSPGYPESGHEKEIGPGVTGLRRMFEVDSAEGDSAAVHDFMHQWGGTKVLASAWLRYGDDIEASPIKGLPNTVTYFKVELDETRHPNEGIDSLFQNGYLFMRAYAYGDTADLARSREKIIQLKDGSWVSVIVCQTDNNTLQRPKNLGFIR